MYTSQDAKQRRDQKVKTTMRNNGPIWMLNDEYRDVEESCLFDLVFDNSIYGWVQHRYKYDAFNDVLYHMGEKRISEAEGILAQEQEPYLSGEVATAVPNHPAGRPSPPLPKVTEEHSPG